jgi:D-alanyl-D-alanine carboxypeptidase (penicillin-binding protein 5/6)
MKKNKFILTLLLSVILSLQAIILPTAFADDEIKNEPADNVIGFEPQAKSVILLEPNSGKIIYEKNSDQQFAPASVTKIMTMLLAMESIDDGRITLQDKIVCSEKVKSMGGSSMILDTGEVRTVEEILKGIAIASGNDAAVAMAEFLEGSEEAFATKMNERAKELGMTNTHFENATGLTASGHLSTARDISIMSRELLKHPTILNYSSIYMETISEGRKTPIELVNHNKLVRFYKGCDGLKTGFTQEAMYCISSTATRDNVRMLAVIMGAPSYKQRNADASKLMDFGFSKYQSKTIVAKDEDVQQIPLNKKGDSFYIAKAKDDLKVTIEKGAEEELTKKLSINSELKKINAGDVVGYCEVYNGDQLLDKVELYSDREVKQSQFFKNVKDIFSNIFDHSI